MKRQDSTGLISFLYRWLENHILRLLLTVGCVFGESIECLYRVLNKFIILQACGHVCTSFL